MKSIYINIRWFLCELCNCLHILTNWDIYLNVLTKWDISSGIYERCPPSDDITKQAATTRGENVCRRGARYMGLLTIGSGVDTTWLISGMYIHHWNMRYEGSGWETVDLGYSQV